MTNFNNFVGAAKRLDDIDIPRIGSLIGVGEDEIHAFMDVEANGSGFDSKRRPKMLFEPHVFHKKLVGSPDKLAKAVNARLAYPKWGQEPYPKDSYRRLLQAIEIDETAALKASSWGLTQILGDNYALAGYTSPAAMVRAFMDDEENHLEATIKTLIAMGIDDDLRAHRWAVVARTWNGPGYRKNKYDTKMADAFAKWDKIRDTPYDRPAQVEESGRVSTSDRATVASVQRKLIELGYPEVGKEDGAWGTKTRAAVLGFRADNGLPLVAGIDNDFLSALMLAAPREVSEERATATAADLKEMGSVNVKAVSRTESAGYVTILGGAGAAITSLAEKTKDFSGITDQFSGVIDSVKALSPWLILAFGAYIVYQQWVAKKAAVEDYRAGRYVGS